tara:strand:+ start:807 stop:968 length:162 start_codon:yes stop_codon:yes gene_type:complete
MGKKDPSVTTRKRSKQKEKDKFEKFGKCSSKHIRAYEKKIELKEKNLKNITSK